MISIKLCYFTSFVTFSRIPTVLRSVLACFTDPDSGFMTKTGIYRLKPYLNLGTPSILGKYHCFTWNNTVLSEMSLFCQKCHFLRIPHCFTVRNWRTLWPVQYHCGRYSTTVSSIPPLRPVFPTEAGILLKWPVFYWNGQYLPEMASIYPREGKFTHLFGNFSRNGVFQPKWCILPLFSAKMVYFQPKCGILAKNWNPSVQCNPKEAWLAGPSAGAVAAGGVRGPGRWWGVPGYGGTAGGSTWWGTPWYGSGPVHSSDIHDKSLSG